jgi:xanthine/CO dehydrogenase XdhC/CoxF family maturation factor
MDDIDTILTAYRALSAAGKHAALATLVDVQGTSFRKIGARMLIDEDGCRTGSITAGCLEAEIAEKAGDVLRTGIPIVARYDTGSDKEILFGWGSGCDGMLTVLIESVAPESAAGVLAYLGGCRKLRQAARIATVFHVDGESAEFKVGQHAVGSEESILLADVTDALLRSSASARKVDVGGAAVHVLVERILPPNRLVILGAGPVADPLSRFAVETGWDVVIVDRRPSFVPPGRFPTVATVLCSPFESFTEHVALDSSSAAVIITHNFLDDAYLIRSLLQSDVHAISILSSRGRAAKLMDTVEEEMGVLSPADRCRLYAPAGLDIGADTPARIALSILAQLQQIFSGATGGALRDKKP